MSNNSPSKYTIVGFIGSNLPQQFSQDDWPLHITLLDPFKTIWSQQELAAEVSKVATQIKLFPMTAFKKSFLGPNKEVPVMLIKKDENMLQAHTVLLHLGERGGFVYNTPEFVGDGFVPHITDRDDERAKFDDAYDLTNLSIVETAPNGDIGQRLIIKRLELT